MRRWHSTPPTAGTIPDRDPSQRALTEFDLAEIARRYVTAFNQRDLEAMLAVMDERVISYPTRLFEEREHRGHDGVRAWWQSMVAAGSAFEVVIREVRVLQPDRVAVLGAIDDHGEAISPWGVVVRIRDGLIVESRSYLSDADLLEAIGHLE